jgi:hypothetical protein
VEYLSFKDELIHPVQLEALKRATPEQEFDAVASLYQEVSRLGVRAEWTRLLN